MSENICNKKNPLQRGGTAQKQRLLEAMKSNYVNIDEHSFSDLLVFANQYATHLKYYNFQNLTEGDWRDFFSEDVSILIALISDTDLDHLEENFDLLLTEVNNEIMALGTPLTPSQFSDLPAAIPSFKKLFDYIFSLAKYLDTQISDLPDETGLKEYAEGLIRNSQAKAFARLFGIYKVAAESFQLIDDTQTDSFETPENIAAHFTQNIRVMELSEYWLETSSDWSGFYTSLDANEYESVYGNFTLPYLNASDVQIKLAPALEPIQHIFQGLIKTFAQIKNEAPAYLKETIDEWPSHPPHIALYLCFLKLFNIAQQYLNGLKNRHLDYYYQEVLRLTQKAQTPSEVHLILQLAKHVDHFLLSEETAFKAGKDEEGKDVNFENLESNSLNKAQVIHLQSLFKMPEGNGIYSSLVSNSLDGIGADLINEDGQWNPFGAATSFLNNDRNLLVDPGDNDADLKEAFKTANTIAEVGFAIASPYLFLKEGVRTIQLDLQIDNLGTDSIPESWELGHFKILLTTEEGWLTKSLTTPEAGVIAFALPGTIRLFCKLELEDPAILPYSKEVHGGEFNTKSPIAKIILQKHNSTYPYSDLSQLKLNQCDLTVSVTGAKEVIVQNDQGRLDPSSTFLPFGPIPNKNSSLTIGSKEIFQKNLDSVSINLEWSGLDDPTNTYNPSGDVDVKIQYLKNGKWSSTSSTVALIDDDLLNEETLLSPSFASGIDGREDMDKFEYDENEPYTVESKAGFLRLSLTQNFGHKQYQQELTKTLIELAKSSITYANIPTQFKNAAGTEEIFKLPPYTPSFKSITVNYSASTQIEVTTVTESAESSYKNNEGQFFHIVPFGQAEKHPHIDGSGNAIPLFPPYEDEGELYLGIEGTTIPSDISILFQVAEGSANPLKEQQDVTWEYLVNNQWTAFASNEFVDETDQLLQSGMITFKLPRAVKTNNTLHASGLVWIRGSVREHTDALCNLITIQAQAIKVTFAENNNDPNFLKNPLEAETISKLVRSDSSIKKITQPYASFNGKIKENSNQFYIRVAERLRHKNRAITIWDYEHLILEAFPEIYKVKCLNHTTLVNDPTDSSIQIDLEIAPGHVMLICIPQLQNKNAIDPLKPYTSLGILNKIDAYLKKIISPHVQLKVKNPRFEQVQLKFKAVYRDNRDPSVYDPLLNQAIVKFLSPWAFESSSDKEIEFGGSIQKSVLIDFIEELPYVDYISHVQLFHRKDENDTNEEDVEEIKASTARSILVSHKKHILIQEEVICE